MLLINLVFKRIDSPVGPALLYTPMGASASGIINHSLPPSQDASFLIRAGRDDRLELPRADAANRGWLGHTRQCRRGHWQRPGRP